MALAWRFRNLAARLAPGAPYAATSPRKIHFVFSADHAARVDSCVTDCSALHGRHHKHRQFGKSARDTIRTPSWTDIKGVYSHLRPPPRVVPPIRGLNNSCSHIVLWIRRRGTDGISHPRVARAVPRWCTTQSVHADRQLDRRQVERRRSSRSRDHSVDLHGRIHVKHGGSNPAIEFNKDTFLTWRKRNARHEALTPQSLGA